MNKHNYTYSDIRNILSDIEKVSFLLRSNIFDNVDWTIHNSPKGKNNEYQKLEWYNFEFLYKISHQLTDSNTEFFENEKDINKQGISRITVDENFLHKQKQDAKLRDAILKARVRLLNEMIRAIDRNKTAAEKHIQYCIALEKATKDEIQHPDTNYEIYHQIEELYPERKKEKILEKINTKTY